MTEVVATRAERIVGESFAQLLGIELVSRETDRVVVRMPYRESLGVGRIHGGAISALVDIAATAAFWSHPDVGEASLGATVGFTINYLKLAVATDLLAEATLVRRGGTILTGDVMVSNPQGDEIAVARVTYKMSRRP
ncbi:MAG: PaaI family thioesterase [Proteobacteria bacterium]|nr:PaaI family thioesterase [Pseudomonadota bacterium]